MNITRILITGDVLRPHPAEPAVSESVARIRWLEDLLRPPLSQVTDLPVSRLSCDGVLDFRELYRDGGVEPSLDAWAEWYAGELPARVEERLLDACRDALVISLEMAPSMAGLLARAGIPLLDAVVDPLRFLFDIPLAWRAPDPRMRDALVPFGVTPYEVTRRVAQIRAKMRWMPAPVIPEGTTLLLDQLPTDAAMIDPVKRRRVRWDEFVDEVRALMHQGPVVWRPHPYNADTAGLEEILGRDAMRSDNFYSLLAQDALVGVAAISSGGVVEARAFGKRGLHFMDRHAGIDLPGWDSPVPVVGHWLSPHFFRAVLSGVIAVPDDVPELTVERDFFRRANNIDWEFGWIDQIVDRRTARAADRAAIGAELRHLHHHAADVDQRVAGLHARALEADRRAAEAERRATEAELRAAQAAHLAAQADQHAAAADTRSVEAGARAMAADARSAHVEERASAVARLATEAMAHHAEHARVVFHARLADEQLKRLRSADRPRLRALGDGLAKQACERKWRVGILGAGAHTRWLLRETALGRLPAVYLFDRQPARGPVEGRPVQPDSDIPAWHLDVVLVSSLAFQDEMVESLRSLGLEDAQILTCYPRIQADDAA